MASSSDDDPTLGDILAGLHKQFGKTLREKGLSSAEGSFIALIVLVSVALGALATNSMLTSGAGTNFLTYLIYLAVLTSICAVVVYVIFIVVLIPLYKEMYKTVEEIRKLLMYQILVLVISLIIAYIYPSVLFAEAGLLICVILSFVPAAVSVFINNQDADKLSKNVDTAYKAILIISAVAQLIIKFFHLL